MGIIRVKINKKDCDNLLHSLGYIVRTISDVVNEFEFKSSEVKRILFDYISTRKCVAYKENMDLFKLRSIIKEIADIEDIEELDRSNSWGYINRFYNELLNREINPDRIVESLIEDRVNELIRDNDI